MVAYHEGVDSHLTTAASPRSPALRASWRRVVVAVAMLAGSGAVLADDADGIRPVAMVGTVPIPRAAVDAVVRRLLPTARPSAEQLMQVEASVIEQLVDEALLRAALTRELAGVTDGEIRNGMERLRGQLASRGQTMEAFLAASGRDETGVREQIRLEVALEKYVQPRLTATAINGFFTEHRRDFDGTRLRVSHVVLRPDIVDEEGIDRRVREAEAIRRDILRGSISFEDAARQFSAAPSRHRGGDIGWITRDGPLVDAFTKPAFMLAKGELSKPVVTPFGVHLVKITEIEPGRVGIDTMRPRVEKMVAATIVRDLLAKARAETEVTYVPGVSHFDPATPADGGQTRRIIVEGSP